MINTLILICSLITSDDCYQHQYGYTPYGYNQGLSPSLSNQINSESLLLQKQVELLQEKIEKFRIENNKLRNLTRWELRDLNEGRRQLRLKNKSRTERMKRAVTKILERREAEEQYYALFPERRPNPKPTIRLHKNTPYVEYELPDGNYLKLWRPYIIGKDRGEYSHVPPRDDGLRLVVRGYDIRLIGTRHKPVRHGIALLK